MPTTAERVVYHGLVVRKLADKSAGSRVVAFHPKTGKKSLVNPETGKEESWPTLGWMIEEIHDKVSIPMDTVQRWVADGFASLEGVKYVHAPGGTKENPFSKTHTFVQADVIVLHTTEGTVRYKVVQQPGKYDLNMKNHVDMEAFMDGQLSKVIWQYYCELEK